MPAAGSHPTARNPFGSRLLGSSDQSSRELRLRVQLLLTLMLVTTNLIGAGLVVVISSFVVPTPAPSPATLLSLFIAVPLYVSMAVVVGASVGTATTLRALRWATNDRTPDVGDRATALRVPLRLTQLQGSLWTIATVLFTSLALVLQPSRALATGLTVGIAGVVVSAIAYLLSQFALRPIAARALAAEPLTERPRGVGFGDRMIIFWCVGTGAPIVGLMIAATLALVGDDTTIGRLAVVVLVLGGVVLVFGLMITVLNARAVVAPVLSVRDAMLDVEQGDLDRVVAVYDGTELGLLQSGFNQMASGLREREHLRDMFGRHVGEEVAAAAASGEVDLGGVTSTVSVLFVDLVASTTYAGDHSPTEVVEVLNRFFGVVVDEVSERDGLVNKFIGDAVLAIFGAPVELADHASAALGAARAIATRLADEVPEVGAGVGVATGDVVAGNVGHRRRFEYTVIGDAVNSASRITDLAKDVDGRVLASWASVESAGQAEASRWVHHGSTTLRGRSSPTELAVPEQP